jgi:hypothetical protein
MNRWAAELIGLPKEAIQASVDYQEFTSNLPSAILVFNAMIKDEYEGMIDVADGEASVTFSGEGGEGRTSGPADSLAMHIVTAAYQVEHGAADMAEDADEGEEMEGDDS